MNAEGDGTLMRVYVAESTRAGGGDAASAIVAALAAAGFAGASALKGIAGFGRSRFVSSYRSVESWVDLPVVIEVVDEDARIRAFVDRLEAMGCDAFVTLERVRMLLRRG